MAIAAQIATPSKHDETLATLSAVALKIDALSVSVQALTELCEKGAILERIVQTAETLEGAEIFLSFARRAKHGAGYGQPPAKCTRLGSQTEEQRKQQREEREQLAQEQREQREQLAQEQKEKRKQQAQVTKKWREQREFWAQLHQDQREQELRERADFLRRRGCSRGKRGSRGGRGRGLLGVRKSRGRGK